MVKIGLCLLILLNGFLPINVSASITDPPCKDPGWLPAEFGLKDHSIFWFHGYYYLISGYIPNENRFAYGRSRDLCTWEVLPAVLTERIPGTWDENAVWSPFVYRLGDIYYLYYTGVTRDFTQSIMLATSTDPSTPDSWIPQGMIFQPDHTGMVWSRDSWADCRDPSVFQIDTTSYLYYAGRDVSGGIIGLASATSPTGPWTDLGAVIPALTITGTIPESPTSAQWEGSNYLFYNIPGRGEHYQIGTTPSGPWLERLPLAPGWAHEVWRDIQGDWYVSYLTDYHVTISPLTWDTFYHPARPFIGSSVYHLLLPALMH